MNKATAEDILREHSLKVTEPRKIILKTLQGVNRPLTAEELQKIIGKAVDFATTYRTLQALVLKGIVYQTDFRDRKAYYEYQDKHHHHVICTGCGKKEETDVCINIKKVSKTLANFKTVDSHVLEFFGICNQCSS